MRAVYFLLSHLEVVTQTGLQELTTVLFTEEHLGAEIYSARQAARRP
jgi:hypothetical protein